MYGKLLLFILLLAPLAPAATAVPTVDTHALDAAEEKLLAMLITFVKCVPQNNPIVCFSVFTGIACMRFQYGPTLVDIAQTNPDKFIIDVTIPGYFTPFEFNGNVMSMATIDPLGTTGPGVFRAEYYNNGGCHWD